MGISGKFGTRSGVPVAMILTLPSRCSGRDVVGVSNPHPHCQVYATNFVFKTIETEAAVSRRYFAEQPA